jgi:hypothetical protein
VTTVRLLGIVLLLVCTSASARAEGFSWSSLNPFSGEEGGSTSSAKSSSWLNNKPLKSTKSKKSDEPGWLARMGTGTKNAWNRTKEAFTVDDEEEPKKRGRHTSWDDPSPYRRTTKKKEESSWWSSWWRSDEPRPSKTVQDFLSQERPEQVQ